MNSTSNISLDAQEIDEKNANNIDYNNNLLTNTDRLLKKSNILLKNHDNLINNEISQLNEIEQDINTKTRLIEINNIEMQKKRYIYDRNIAFGILCLALVNIYLFNKNIKLSLAKILILTIILIISYYLYITYLYNYYELREPTFKSPYDKSMDTDKTNDIYEDTKFKNENCDCSSNEELSVDNFSNPLKKNITYFETSSIGSIQSNSKNNNTYQLNKWMTDI